LKEEGSQVLAAQISNDKAFSILSRVVRRLISLKPLFKAFDQLKKNQLSSLKH